MSININNLLRYGVDICMGDRQGGKLQISAVLALASVYSRAFIAFHEIQAMKGIEL